MAGRSLSPSRGDSAVKTALALALLLLLCPCALGAPAPFPKPDEHYLDENRALDGTAGIWRLDWRRKHPHLLFAMKLSRDGRYRAALLKGKSIGSRDHPLTGREVYAWRGTWSFDKRVRTLTVRETRDGRRWYRWTATLDKDGWGGVEGDFGPRGVLIRAMPPPGGFTR
jgi:hypothetical protein